MASDAPEGRWLSIVGIGEDGVSGLGERARALLAGAEVVFGGRRHLALAEGLLRGHAEPWPTPFDVAPVLALKGRRVTVLASGDPMLWGVGATLARHVPAAEMAVVPAPSAFSLAAARLGWALQDVAAVSAHGRAIERLRPHLQPGRRVLALTSDGEGPAAIARLLVADRFGASRLHVLEALGGPRECIRPVTAKTFDLGRVDELNVVAIEVVADPEARVLPRAAGLADDLFEHDGQMTKRVVRAATLSALAPRRGELLWDVGAGAGSVAIEWLLADPAMHAIAIEANAERAERLTRNAVAFGVPDLRLVLGHAPEALDGLPEPDAIFIGGGGSEPGVMPAALSALKSGGRLVANAVTLEMEAVLLHHHARLGGELTRLAVSRAEPVGGMTGWRAAMPVTQWTWVKP